MKCFRVKLGENYFEYYVTFSLKERDPKEFASHLCNLMEEPDLEMAASALQRRFEGAVSSDKDLYKLACFGE